MEKTPKITYTGFDKLILFGGSFLMASLLEAFQKEKIPVVVFSSVRHLDGVVTDTKETLRSVLSRLRVRFFESEDINSDENLRREVTSKTLGLALGAAWTFEKRTVSLFAEGHLLDFMGIDLPRYRGGAHYSWQILHGNRTGAAHLQVILGGEETFHRGPVMFSNYYRIPKDAKTPKDFFSFLGKKETALLRTFIGAVRKGRTFMTRPLDEKESSFFPFLSTSHQGYIDWSWEGKDIERFIAAFDEPYAGASTFVGTQRVFLKSAALLRAPEDYHPFTSGIVIRKNDESVFAAVRGGLLRIQKVVDVNGNDMHGSILLGARFFTPNTVLDAAMEYSAEYAPSGLTQKKQWSR